MQETPAFAGAMAQLQPGTTELAQLATGKTADRLTPHVGTPGWDQALGQKVVWMVAGAQQSASLSLNPPDLGPLQIVLNVNNGQADASFFAAQPEVRQALEAALPRLRDMMNDAGVQLGQASVSAGMPNRHDQPGERSASQGKSGTSDQGGNDSALPAGRVTQVTQGQGLVDTFV
jgi:flagellar hook-length control protein FliK